MGSDGIFQGGNHVLFDILGVLLLILFIIWASFVQHILYGITLCYTYCINIFTLTLVAMLLSMQGIILHQNLKARDTMITSVLLFHEILYLVIWKYREILSFRTSRKEFYAYSDLTDC